MCPSSRHITSPTLTVMTASEGIEKQEGITTPSSRDGKDVSQIQQASATPSISAEAQSIDPTVEKRVLRKIDWFFMPAMVFGMLETNLSYAVRPTNTDLPQ